MSYTSIDCFTISIQGSGKTYTMTGGNISSIREKDFGIVPRAVQTIFDTVKVRLILLIKILTKFNLFDFLRQEKIVKSSYLHRFWSSTKMISSIYSMSTIKILMYAMMQLAIQVELLHDDIIINQ
jgi:hypothetical protein